MAVEIGQSLPNLKITVGNDGKIEDIDEDNTEKMELDDEPKLQNVQIVRKLISPLESFRVYENKGGAFITGLDLSSEVVSKKLADRAARFGLEDRPQNPITQVEIDTLYKSLDIDSEGGKCKNIRLDALHVRGVEEMSTSEVIDYFKEYGPSSVEWINDCCCNVVWLDKAGAARALLGLSKVLVVRKKSSSSPVKQNQSEEETQGGNDNHDAVDAEEVIYMSDISSDEGDDDEEGSDKLIAFKHQKSGNPVDINTPQLELPIKDSEPTKDIPSKCENDLPVDVPVPPGHWRLGIPHLKAKAILLRFATKEDRKLPGAERRSHYYQKYGNPNYGGMTGLISNTKKRRFNITKQKHIVEQLSAKGNFDSLKTSITEHTHGRKRLRMRMHADDEEEKMRIRNAKKQRTVESMSSRRNVHDRLGDFVPQRRMSHEDDRWNKDSDEEAVHIKSAISKSPGSKNKTSRFDVWTRLAENMAKESEMFESSEDSLPPMRHQIQDLRSKIPSSRGTKASYTDKPHGDLRSKLRRIRKNEKPTTHRSPLLIELDNQMSD